MKWFKCCYCNELKSEVNFYRDSQKRSGYRPRCKACEKLYIDRPNRRKYEKEYRLQNLELRRNIVKKSIVKNKEHNLEVLNKYRKTDQYKANHRMHGATRRARMRAAYIEKVDYLNVYRDAGGCCEYCNKPLSFGDAEFDHFIPIAKGGTHERKNIKCSCMHCNRSKGSTIPKEGVMSYQVV